VSIFLHKINPGDVSVNPIALARLMGLDPTHIPEPYSGLINKEIALVKSYENMQGGYRIIDDVKFDKENNIIILEDVSFHLGKQVMYNLRDSHMLAFFACTAGREITDRSQKYMSSGDYLEGYVADLTGSLLAEAAMDLVQKRLTDEMGQRGLKVTNRYSPGYCHWNVGEQHLLFSLFPENFCGITLSDSALMHPIKSVSGVIGIGKNVRFNKYVCNTCSDQNCFFRNVSTSSIL
jgi:hypothetical protein